MIARVWSVMAWILFRSGGESRDLEQGLAGVRRTIAVGHGLAALAALAAFFLDLFGIGFVGPVADWAGLAIWLSATAGSLGFCVRAYRSLARDLREELVREVMES